MEITDIRGIEDLIPKKYVNLVMIILAICLIGFMAYVTLNLYYIKTDPCAICESTRGAICTINPFGGFP